jgi:hypothetical protein
MTPTVLIVRAVIKAVKAGKKQRAGNEPMGFKITVHAYFFHFL